MENFIVNKVKGVWVIIVGIDVVYKIDGVNEYVWYDFIMMFKLVIKIVIEFSKI